MSPHGHDALLVCMKWSNHRHLVSRPTSEYMLRLVGEWGGFH